MNSNKQLAAMSKTRFKILQRVMHGGTQVTIADALGVTPAAVSRHLHVLKDLGFVVGPYDVVTPRWKLTTLGSALIALVARAETTRTMTGNSNWFDVSPHEALALLKLISEA